MREDPVLGRLSKEKDVNWLTATLQVEQRPVAVHLSLDECEDEDALVDLASTWAFGLADHVFEAKEYASDRMLKLKNGAWLDEGEAPVTPELFAQRLLLKSVTVFADRKVDLFFNDGDLFWGHTVIISGDVDDQFTHAEIGG